MEFLVLIILLLANGLLAMYEIALVSAGKIRLTALAEQGSHSAKRVLQQLENSDQTLSTIQIGITLIGIISGAFGGLTLSDDVETWIGQSALLRPYAPTVALVLTVGIITYLSLVVGELVPKAIALSQPERYAMRLSAAIAALTWLCYPFVSLLSLSTRGICRAIGISASESRAMTQEEIKIMLKESSEHGVIAPQASEMLQDVFKFSDKRVCDLMTPRHELVVFHLSDTRDTIVSTIARHNFSKYLLVDGTIDDIVGTVAVKDIIGLLAASAAPTLPLKDVAHPALFLPESIYARKAVELFKHNKTKFGVVVDEYGSAEGIVTLSDLTESIFGDIPEGAEPTEPDVVRRQDGSLLVDGGMNIADFYEEVQLRPSAELQEQKFNTVGGLAMYIIGRLPRTGDTFTLGHATLEVVDMDGERVDKLLVTFQQPHKTE